MGYARKDLEKTKKIAKKFVRYQEGAQTRKDLRGRVLRKGESQRRSDGRYVYTYTDPLGRRKYVYTQDLVALREKEAQLMKDQMDGLDIYVAGKATVNFVFDHYMSLKNNLKPTTKSNYLYIEYTQDAFGIRLSSHIYIEMLKVFSNNMNVPLGNMNDNEFTIPENEKKLADYVARLVENVEIEKPEHIDYYLTPRNITSLLDRTEIKYKI